MSNVPGQVNALLREVRKSIPYWEGKSHEWDNYTDEEKRDHIIYQITDGADIEVNVAFQQLVEAVLTDRNNQKQIDNE